MQCRCDTNQVQKPHGYKQNAEQKEIPIRYRVNTASDIGWISQIRRKI